MSATSVTLKYLLVGEDRSASAVMKRVGGQADDTGKRVGGMSNKSKIALLAVAGAATAFATSSVNKFKQVGSETMGLQRVLGGTTEDASRLRFAASQTGVSYETMAKSTGKLAKALYAAGGSAKANSAMVQTLGFNYRDAAGHILPMYQLLPKLEDKFSKMKNGPEKTALAMKLFGKAGTDMLPFLNKGRAGIAGLEKESDKFGLTLTGKNIAALKASKASQREWNASLDGLKVQVGAQLLPILNVFVGFIRDHIIPFVTKLTGFIHAHKNAVMLAVVVIGTLVIGMKAWAIAQRILNAVMAVNPIGLVVIAIAALAAGIIYAYKHSQTFRHIVQAAMGAVKTAIGWVVTAFHAVTHAVGAVIDWVRGHWRLLLAIITGPIGVAVLVITRHWDSIKRGFGAVVDFVRDKVRAIISFFAGLPGAIVALGGRMLNAGKHLISSWWDGIKSAASGAAHFVGNIISSMANGIKNAINDILHLPWTLPQFKIGAFGHYVHVGGQTLFPRLAQGGMVNGPGLFMMGDNPGGREVALPLNSPHTTTALAKALAQAGGGRSGDVNVNITIQGVVDKQGAAQEIRTVLLGLKRTLRSDLGIA